MVTLRKKPRTEETPVNPKQPNNNHEQHTQGSGYEQCREKRIKENMERMQKLGLFDLSSKLKSDIFASKKSPRKPYERRTPQPSPVLSPARRSSRLQSMTPVIYAEELRGKREKGGKRERHSRPVFREGRRPEIYTEEHDKLLGTCEGTWTLFVDGVGKDGKRIYDSINGKTCHQCRQKTLGHRTHCISCNLVQGQFCGDCLYMRYGEHVLEANQNPNWICPPCRGICNCSLCRLANGWAPTGALYRHIKNLGFKSVAHYLIQTRRAETKSDDIADDPVPVKRSLPFSDTAEVAEEKDTQNTDAKLEGEPNGTVNLVAVKEDELKGGKDEIMNEHNVSTAASASKANPKSIASRLRRNKSGAHYDMVPVQDVSIVKEDGLKGDIGTRSRSSCDKSESDSLHNITTDSTVTEDDIGTDNSVSVKRSGEQESMSDSAGTSKAASGSEKTRRRKSGLIYEPNPDSISGRLRQRRNKA